MRTLLGVAIFSLYPHRAEKSGEFCEVSFKRTLDLPGGSDGKVSAYNVETWVHYLGWEDLLEKEMATHSSNLAWKIPWMEEPGRLQSMGSQMSLTRLSDFTFTSILSII